MRLESLDIARLPAVSTSIMSAILRAEGLRSESLFRSVGLNPDQVGGGRISAAQELQFQHGFVALTRERRGLWLRTGEHYRLLTYGAHGLTVLTAASFRDAILTAIRDDLTFSLGHCRPVERDGVIVGLEMDMSEVPPELRDFTILRDVGAIVTYFHDLRNEPFPFSHIELATHALDDPTLFERIRCPVVFDAPRTAVHWPPEATYKPLPQSDPHLHAHYRMLWEEQLPKAGLAATLGEILQDVLRDGAAAEELTLEMLAGRMGYSARTLQRRLQDQGATYRQIVGGARNAVAAELLRKTELSIAEIGWQLGYSETAAFSHAFRAWTSESPFAYRNRHQNGGLSILSVRFDGNGG